MHKNKVLPLTPYSLNLTAGFTLLELVVVVGIVAILGTISVMVLNPDQILKQSRDTNRITEINSINNALLYYQAGKSNATMGSHNVMYLSLPSNQADCSDLGLPAAPSGWSYACKPIASYRNMDGTGWIPVDFASINGVVGNLFSAIPIDPINTIAGDHYYTYIYGSWTVSATLESDKYLNSAAANDGGASPVRSEVGNNLDLNSNLPGNGKGGGPCGNNQVNAWEVCDGTNLDNQTCATQAGTGYTGTLSCNSECTAFVTSACVAPAPSGEIGSFIAGTPITLSRYLHSSIFANGYIYVIGGRNIYDDGSVFYSKINADGSNGPWQTTIGFPVPLEQSSAVIANGYVYVMGGYSSGAQSDVYHAKLNSDGTIGSWIKDANSLPDLRFRHTSVFTNGYIYVIGGTSYYRPATETVYYAKVNADGSVDPWQTSPNPLNFPGIREHSSVEANGYVYVIGGFDGGDWRTETYYAKLNSDGSNGPWQTNINNLPVGLYLHSSVVNNGYVYVFGGYTRYGPQSDVYYAKLNSDGSLGPWQTNSSTLFESMFGQTSFAINNYIYTIGGGTGGGNAQNFVYYAHTK